MKLILWGTFAGLDCPCHVELKGHGALGELVVGLLVA